MRAAALFLLAGCVYSAGPGWGERSRAGRPGMDGLPLDPDRPVVVRIEAAPHEDGGAPGWRVVTENYPLAPGGNHVHLFVGGAATAVLDESPSVPFVVPPGVEIAAIACRPGHRLWENAEAEAVLPGAEAGPNVRWLIREETIQAGRPLTLEIRAHPVRLTPGGYRARVTWDGQTLILSTTGAHEIAAPSAPGRRRLTIELLDASGRAVDASQAIIDVLRVRP